jgi:hypothetical protein
VIDSKQYRGRLQLDPSGRLWHGRYSLTPTLRAVSFEADQAAQVLPDPGLAAVPIVAVHGGPGALGQGRHRRGAGGAGQAPAKHASRSSGGAGTEAGRLVGRSSPHAVPLRRISLTIPSADRSERPLDPSDMAQCAPPQWVSPLVGGTRLKPCSFAGRAHKAASRGDVHSLAGSSTTVTCTVWLNRSRCPPIE